MKILVLAFALAVPGLAPAAELPSGKPPPAVPASYVSAFEGYRPLTDEPMHPWREANDAVGQLGGHMGHAGETTGAAVRPTSGSAATPARPAPVSDGKASPGGHSGHHR